MSLYTHFKISDVARQCQDNPDGRFKARTTVVNSQWQEIAERSLRLFATLPYPSPALIAKRMGVSRRTIERRLVRLQATGWLKRLPGNAKEGKLKIRKYDLSGMVKRLQEAVVGEVNQREQYAHLKRELANKH